MEGKKQITTEAINELFGIKESFELPASLMSKLLDKEEKDKLCRAFMEFDFDMKNDCLRDYFQSNAANRSELKQDYTPDCLCQLISKLIPKTEKIIDICSGTGALTINTARDGVQYQCEELSQMSIPVLLFNLALRNISATILQKNVLTNTTEKIYILEKGEEFSDITITAEHQEEKVDVVISNPPYSLKWKPKQDDRFEGYDLAPAKAADYAFVLDGLSRLTDAGQAFYILPHGVLFIGNSEGKIIKQLLENNLIDAIIGLPDKLFLNTSIPVCVIVFNKAKKTDDVLFISAEKLFDKSGKQNVMTDEHIKKIAEVYKKRETVEKFSAVVSIEEIRENDYNLNIPRYVDIFEREKVLTMSEAIKQFIECDIELKMATREHVSQVKQLVGDDEFNKQKDEFIEYFENNDIVGETMCEWLRLQQLESRLDYIKKHAKQERKSVLELADFERVKKEKVYKAGTIYIQLSATDGIVRYLDEDKELEEKYGVFIPKSEYICALALYYAIESEISEFLSRYQSGLNINPDIFKYMKITHFPEQKYQKELEEIIRGFESAIHMEQDMHENLIQYKKSSLSAMFPAC